MRGVWGKGGTLPIFGLNDIIVTITSDVTDTYVDGIGLVEKIVDVQAVPSGTDSGLSSYSEYIDVTITLDSYDVN